MKYLFTFVFCIGLLSNVTIAFAQDTTDFYNRALDFMRSKDYDNAQIVLKKGLEEKPGNALLKKQLAFSYYFQDNNTKALEILKPLIDNKLADDQCYQIAGNIYRESGQGAEREKLFRKGIQQFPENGVLYNELGNVLWEQKNNNAISYWEKGIEEDPNYSKNYYNAARYYYLKEDWFWTIIYSELFINLESFSPKTPEIKEVLLWAYKKYFLQGKSASMMKYSKGFSGVCTDKYFKQSELTKKGITTSTLVMIRTRFMLDWFNGPHRKFPFKLFEFHRDLTRFGMFEAYNQWLFGSTENLNQFQNWVQMNNNIYNTLIKGLQSGKFSLPAKQYYH